jgi:hypothetical protein
VTGSFEDSVTETGPGSVVASVNFGTSFKGNSGHQLTGTCSNSIINFQGAACQLL